MRRGLIIYALLLSIVLPRWAWGATYYVAESAAGSGDGSSYANRMSVAMHNVSSFDAGDTVYLCDTITSQVVVLSSGSFGAVITYRGDYAGHGGMINTNNESAIKITGKNYVSVTDLEITALWDGIVVYGGCDNVSVKRCIIHDTISHGVNVTDTELGANPCSNIVIGGSADDANQMYDLGCGTAGADINICWVNGFTVSYNHLYATKSAGLPTDRGIDGIHMIGSTNGLIEYNTIHDHNDNYFDDPIGGEDEHWRKGCGEDGIDIKEGTHDVVIRCNHIYNHKYQTGVTVQSGSYDISIFGNSLHDNKWAGVMVKDSSSKDFYTKDVHIWANLIYDNLQCGILIHHHRVPVVNVGVYNNVIATNGDPTYTFGNTSLTGLKICGGSMHLVKNNIFYKNRPHETDYRQAYLPVAGSTTLDCNMYYWPGHPGKEIFRWGGSNITLDKLKDLGQEANGSEGDPGFTDAASHIYTLTSLSANRNTGVDLGSAYRKALDPISIDWSTIPPSAVSISQPECSRSEKGAYVYRGKARFIPPQRLRLSN